MTFEIKLSLCVEAIRNQFILPVSISSHNTCKLLIRSVSKSFIKIFFCELPFIACKMQVLNFLYMYRDTKFQFYRFFFIEVPSLTGCSFWSRAPLALTLPLNDSLKFPLSNRVISVCRSYQEPIHFSSFYFKFHQRYLWFTLVNSCDIFTNYKQDHRLEKALKFD